MRLTLPSAIVIVLFAGLLGAAAPPAVAAEGPLYTVSGHVLSDTGAPLEGVRVSGWSSTPDGGEVTSADTVTDASGAFTMKLGAGKASINAWHDKWRANDAKELVIDGNVENVQLTLRTPPPKLAIVEGTVTDAEGNPVEGALVTMSQGCCYHYRDGGGVSEPGIASDAPLTTPSPTPPPGDASQPDEKMASSFYYDGDHQEEITGADGKFRFETYPGPRQVTANAKGFAQTTVQVEAEDNEEVNADLTLVKVPKADAVVKGRVVDAKTGLPLSNAGVSINNVEWNRYEYATTDGKGEFELTTLPGWTQISVYYYGPAEATVVSDEISVRPHPGGMGQQYYQWQTTLRVRSGENPLDVKLEQKPEPTLVLVGYVVDPETQTGIANANVNVWNQDTGDWGAATTDATGSYKILVRAGHYTMNAWAEKHLPTSITFVVREDENAKRVDIEMPAGEQRYAPCDDCGPYPMAIAEKGADGYSSRSADSPPMASTPATTSSSQNAGLTVDASGQEDQDSTRAAAFQGSGGGLPPYDPAKKGDASVAGDTQAPEQTPQNAVPAAGLVLGLAGLALAAIALRRK